MYTPSITETIENPPPTSKPISGGSNATFEPSSSTPFSPTEHAVQLQYPPPESKSNPSDTYISEQVPVSKPVTALIEPPELKPAVAASGQPSSNSPPKTDIKDPKSLHLPHLHVPSMFHDKSDPIHKVNEYDVDGIRQRRLIYGAVLDRFVYVCLDVGAFLGYLSYLSIRNIPEQQVLELEDILSWLKLLGL
ncbi:predicted protein [Naegleria gruberi]|uniref:Predicted protein n=1 Tax=Naegleria gruberi TaxID=5762 RepID=D2VZJ3_NAEGR|nr:uncharacterized protein NAEGRDRAFT_59681 [Naegleria gruberi]EFC37801.1 predicted protein [Naegleria gruberi]|eukprot:XP_002670545.1 predicted protein [Naegleria gruberi strain NEG-M]